MNGKGNQGKRSCVEDQANENIYKALRAKVN